jgi:hypothetical protein
MNGDSFRKRFAQPLACLAPITSGRGWVFGGFVTQHKSSSGKDFGTAENAENAENTESDAK